MGIVFEKALRQSRSSLRTQTSRRRLLCEPKPQEDVARRRLVCELKRQDVAWEGQG
jgi:hypothetical protein